MAKVQQADPQYIRVYDGKGNSDDDDSLKFTDYAYDLKENDFDNKISSFCVNGM